MVQEEPQRSFFAATPWRPGVQGQLPQDIRRPSMPFRYRRHRCWIALFALIGLLFLQFAMAAYIYEHCHPTMASADRTPALPVPPALLPATT